MAKKIISNLHLGSITVSGASSNIFTSTSVSGTNLVYSGANSGIGTLQVTYHVLGEDIQVSGNAYQSKDPVLVTNIATLNVLGKPFLDELHKNRTFFPQEIEEYLEKKFKWLERDKKIDDIIN
jgi:hypothetical protein